MRFEQTRQRYRFVLVGHIVMPEHVNLLISERERRKLSLVIQISPHSNVILSED